MAESPGMFDSCDGAAGWPTAAPMVTDCHYDGPGGTGCIDFPARRTVSVSRRPAPCPEGSHHQRDIIYRERTGHIDVPVQQRWLGIPRLL